MDLFHAFSAGVGIARTAQAEEQARSTVHVDYEAFEAEFMRLVESAAARAIVESGL